MIRTDAWRRHSIWDHSETVAELYKLRAAGEAPEMTCHAQALDILSRHVAPGDTLLDAGCGSGALYHAVRRRNLSAEYWGIDPSPRLIGIAREGLCGFGLSSERLIELRIEDGEFDVDHCLCINVLSNIDNYHRPLERLLTGARKTVILRESLGETSEYSYVRDDYLNGGVDLKVHVNTYGRAEFAAFIAAYGFDVTFHTDAYTSGAPQMVIGYPHRWTFVEAVRRSGTACGRTHG